MFSCIVHVWCLTDFCESQPIWPRLELHVLSCIEHSGATTTTKALAKVRSSGTTGISFGSLPSTAQLGRSLAAFSSIKFVSWEFWCQQMQLGKCKTSGDVTRILHHWLWKDFRPPPRPRAFQCHYSEPALLGTGSLCAVSWRGWRCCRHIGWVEASTAIQMPCLNEALLTSAKRLWHVHIGWNPFRIMQRNSAYAPALPRAPQVHLGASFSVGFWRSWRQCSSLDGKTTCRKTTQNL